MPRSHRREAQALKDARFPNADAYQMLAYCTAFGLKRGYLVYANANLTLLRALAVASVDITCGRRGRVPRRAASARRAGAGGGPRALGRLTISATDWSERRWSVTVSPRRNLSEHCRAAGSRRPGATLRGARTAHLGPRIYLGPRICFPRARCCTATCAPAYRHVGPYGPRSARVADPSEAVRGVESVAYERMF
jgi:hypothetical protein